MKTKKDQKGTSPLFLVDEAAAWENATSPRSKALEIEDGTSSIQ